MNRLQFPCAVLDKNGFVNVAWHLCNFKWISNIYNLATGNVSPFRNTSKLMGSRKFDTVCILFFCTAMSCQHFAIDQRLVSLPHIPLMLLCIYQWWMIKKYLERRNMYPSHSLTQTTFYDSQSAITQTEKNAGDILTQESNTHPSDY